MPATIYKDSGNITQHLHNWSTGNRDAENELFEAVLPDLRRLAQYLMKGERPGHPLEPADLVNQIYFRLAAAKGRSWQNPRHFSAVAARAMRQHLIDYARARGSKKFVTLEEAGDGVALESKDLETFVSLGCLLDQLAKTNAAWRLLLELKYFLGLTDEESAKAMRMRVRTMQRMCADALQWLSERADPEGIRRSRRQSSFGPSTLSREKLSPSAGGSFRRTAAAANAPFRNVDLHYCSRKDAASPNVSTRLP